MFYNKDCATTLRTSRFILSYVEWIIRSIYQGATRVIYFMLCFKMLLPGEVKGIIVFHVLLAASLDSSGTVAQEFDAGSFVVA